MIVQYLFGVDKTFKSFFLFWEALLGCCIALFAGWTVLCWAVVILDNGTFSQLVDYAYLSFIPVLVYILLWNRADHVKKVAFVKVRKPEGLKLHSKIIFYIFLLGLLCSYLIFGYVTYWISSIFFLGVCLVVSSSNNNLSSLGEKKFRSDFFAVLMFLIFILLAFLSGSLIHWPESDDGFFVNMAVTALGSPADELLRYDGMTDIRSVPIFPVYKIHSFQLLWGYIAHTFHVEPVFVSHVIFPPVMSGLMAITVARLLQILSPENWHWGCLGIFIFWLVVRDSGEGYSNFALFRPTQGKSFVLTAMVYLTIVNTIEFVTKPKPLSYVLLVFTSIAAVGISSTAIFLLPLVAGLTLLALFLSRQCGFRLSLIALSSFIFITPIAYYCWFVMQDVLPVLNSWGLRSREITFFYGYEKVFGRGGHEIFMLFIVFAWIPLFKNSAIKLFLLMYILLCFLLIFNPYLFDFWVAYVTSPVVFFRLFFLLPVPIFFAIFISSIMCFSGEARKRMLLFLGGGSLILQLIYPTSFLFSNTQYSTQLKGGVSLNVPKPVVAIHEKLKKNLDQGDVVLATKSVSIWLPIFKGHVRPLVAKSEYLITIRDIIGGDEFLMRQSLYNYISGVSRTGESALLLRASFEKYKIKSVIIGIDNKWRDEIISVCQLSGFTLIKLDGYDVLVLSSSYPKAMNRELI